MLKVNEVPQRVPVSAELVEKARGYGVALLAYDDGDSSPRIMWRTPGTSDHWTFFDGTCFTYVSTGVLERVAENYHNGRVINLADNLKVHVNA